MQKDLTKVSSLLQANIVEWHRWESVVEDASEIFHYLTSSLIFKSNMCTVLLELYTLHQFTSSIVDKYTREIVQIGNVQVGNVHIRLEMFRLEMFGLEMVRLKTRLNWRCQK